MPKHEDSVPLQHMLDHAQEAVDMIAGKKRADLDLPPLITQLEKHL